jgi:hypothetical protein
MSVTCECTIENAPLFWEWVRNRGGVAVWPSLDLSNPAGFSTPAMTDGKLTCKPHWRVADEPTVFTDPTKITVIGQKEVKRFRVGVRRGSQGFSLKITDGGTRRINRALAKAGEGATYRFDYDTQEAVIYGETETMSLQEWVDKGRVKAKRMSFDPRNGPR